MKPLIVPALSHKGGSGKSTAIINLLVAAHLDGVVAIALDVDDGASSSDWYAARTNKARLQQVVVDKLRAPAWDDGNAEMARMLDDVAAEYAMPLVQPTHHAGIAAQLEVAEQQGVEMVFIDTKAGTERATMAALEAADAVILPMAVSQMDLRQSLQTVRLCNAEGKRPFVLLGDFDAQGPEMQEMRAGLEAADVTVIPGGFGHRKAYKRSLIPGLGVMEYDPKGTAAEEVASVYRYLRKVLDSKRVSTPESKRVRKVARHG
jgi:chromosome partitioning protein